MSVVTAALRELMALGVQGDALLAAVARIEQAALDERASTVQEAVEIATRVADAGLPHEDPEERRRRLAAERQARKRERDKSRAERDCNAESVTIEVESVTSHAEAPRTCAQVVNTTSSLRSEGNPPVEPIGSTAPKGGEKTRGTRLPDDWRPDERGWKAAAEILGPDIDPNRELDRFLDYWRAVPGAKGRKTDWTAAWRNWCRTAADNLARRAHAKPPRSPAQPATTRADRRGVWAEIADEERGPGTGLLPRPG